MAVITIELLFTMIASLPRVRVMRALRPFIVFLYDPRLRFLGAVACGFGVWGGGMLAWLPS